MYAIFLNQMQGVELILKALRKQPCIASQELADGIQANLHYSDGKTPFKKLDTSHRRYEPGKPQLTLLKGNGHAKAIVPGSEGDDAS